MLENSIFIAFAQYCLICVNCFVCCYFYLFKQVIYIAKFHTQWKGNSFAVFVAPPSQPRNVKVDRVNRTGVNLSWQKPTEDGGKPIQGYIIEKKSAQSPR